MVYIRTSSAASKCFPRCDVLVASVVCVGLLMEPEAVKRKAGLQLQGSETDGYFPWSTTLTTIFLFSCFPAMKAPAARRFARALIVFTSLVAIAGAATCHNYHVIASPVWTAISAPRATGAGPVIPARSPVWTCLLESFSCRVLSLFFSLHCFSEMIYSALNRRVPWHSALLPRRGPGAAPLVSPQHPG